ncbi:MAG: hypothetical protein EOP54_09115 [Sphingobacteriales bacterium]|nr:MAG: hypothetical protein EOP54_09115 [Sphingobacteriales bacterium]
MPVNGYKFTVRVFQAANLTKLKQMQFLNCGSKPAPLKKTILFILFSLVAGIVIVALVNFKSTKNYLGLGQNDADTPFIAVAVNERKLEELTEIARNLAAYAAKNGYDTSIFFILDMKQASGRKRFHIYDWKQKKIRQSALVTHGNCYEVALAGRKYNNVVGGGCTSLGRYKIGQPYQGKFGLAYKMYGLDTSNNNAFERFVVLHAHSCVPDGEVHPYPVCQSNGCPTVSPDFLQALAKIIDNSPKPVLMEIYDKDYQ